MENLIDKSFDEELLKINELTWLPWIGRDFTKTERRLLVIGESHYIDEKDEEIFKISFQNASNDKLFTRNCIFESPIKILWKNRTFENIPKALLKTSNYDRELLWKQVAFYNFIPRLMDYRVKERPSVYDFYNSWKTFIEVVKILKPTDCIFIGVSASNTYNPAINDLKLNFTHIKWRESIGNAYGRTSTLNLDDKTIKLSFIQHASRGFSWFKWNNFLSRENHEIITYLKNSLSIQDSNNTESEVIDDEQENKDAFKINVPTWLTHKPVIACDYSDYTRENDDAKFLSIGHSQYDYNSSSVKIFRHSGKKWSRQSEEIPIRRVGDIALLLLKAMEEVYTEDSEKSILNEEIIKGEELSFLKGEFENNKERLKASFLEIKRILNKLDFEKF